MKKSKQLLLLIGCITHSIQYASSDLVQSKKKGRSSWCLLGKRPFLKSDGKRISFSKIVEKKNADTEAVMTGCIVHESFNPEEEVLTRLIRQLEDSTTSAEGKKGPQKKLIMYRDGEKFWATVYEDGRIVINTKDNHVYVVGNSRDDTPGETLTIENNNILDVRFGEHGDETIIGILTDHPHDKQKLLFQVWQYTPSQE